MSAPPDRTEAANDLLTVTVSFVLYMTMLLVLVTVQGEENGEAARPGWSLQDLAALVMLVGGLAHLVGTLFIVRQRQFRLTLAGAEVLSAGSLYLLAPGAWVWLVLAAGAFAAWAFSFQTAIVRFMEGPEEEPTVIPAEPDAPPCPLGEASQEPEAQRADCEE